MRTILLLTAVAEGQLHLVLGFPTVPAYSNHYTGLSARTTRDFLALGRKLRRLPRIAEALEAGTLSWTKAREICRRATEEDQERLLELAGACSRRELEETLSQQYRDEAQDKGAVQKREASDTRGLSSADSATLLPLSSTVPEKNDLDTRHRKPPPVLPVQRPAQITSPRSPDRCHVTLAFSPEQYARWTAMLSRQAPIGSSTEDRLLTALAEAGEGGKPAGPRANRPPYLVVIVRCPDCGQAGIVTSRGEATAPPALIAASACDAVVEDDQGRRRSTIAPRLRRQALQRARYCCEAARCRNTQFLEVHHRIPHGNGGHDTLDNLVVLCASCHRALHEGETALTVARQDALGIVE